MVVRDPPYGCMDTDRIITAVAVRRSVADRFWISHKITCMHYLRDSSTLRICYRAANAAIGNGYNKIVLYECFCVNLFLELAITIVDNGAVTNEYHFAVVLKRMKVTILRNKRSKFG